MCNKRSHAYTHTACTLHFEWTCLGEKKMKLDWTDVNIIVLVFVTPQVSLNLAVNPNTSSATVYVHRICMHVYLRRTYLFKWKIQRRRTRWFLRMDCKWVREEEKEKIVENVWQWTVSASINVHVSLSLFFTFSTRKWKTLFCFHSLFFYLSRSPIALGTSSTLTWLCCVLSCVYTLKSQTVHFFHHRV